MDFKDTDEWTMNASIAAKELRTLAFSEANSYKRNAFLTAANNIEILGARLGAYFPDKFKQIRGVGDSTAKILRDLFDKGMSTRVEVAKIDLEKKELIDKDGVVKRPVEDVIEMVTTVLNGIKLFRGVSRAVIAGGIGRGEKFVSEGRIVAVVENNYDRIKIGRFIFEKGDEGEYGTEKASAIFDSGFRITVVFCCVDEFDSKVGE